MRSQPGGTTSRDERGVVMANEASVAAAGPVHELPLILMSDSRGIQPTTVKGRKTRKRLVESARVVFERDGFLNARVADIAKEAGVSHGTFYTYFDSKVEIFRVIVADVMSLVWDANHDTTGNDSLSALGRIERANRGFIRIYRENGSMLALMEQAVGYDKEVREIRLAVRQVSVDRIRRSVERMQREGIGGADVDPAICAAALVSMVSNFVYFWLILGEGDYDEDLAVATLTNMWASALHMST